jgi:hypothetical protein
VAIRVRPLPIQGSDLLMNILAQRGHTLVASPDLAEASRRDPCAAGPEQPPEPRSRTAVSGPHLEVEDPDGARAIIHHRSRLISDDMIALRGATIAVSVSVSCTYARLGKHNAHARCCRKTPTQPARGPLERASPGVH